MRYDPEHPGRDIPLLIGLPVAAALGCLALACYAVDDLIRLARRLRQSMAPPRSVTVSTNGHRPLEGADVGGETDERR
jgi:hypothetical protein